MKFTLDTSLRASHGYTVTNPVPFGSTAVTFNDMASTPTGGVIPARSVRRTRSSVGPPIRPLGTSTRACGLSRGRVSKARSGVVAATKLDPVANHPAMSTTMSVVALLKKHNSPDSDNGAMTALDTIWPAAKFTDDTGSRSPHG